MLGWKENKIKEYYWAIVIEPGSVQAGVWEIADAKAKVISVSKPAAWETDEELIEAADATLSSSVQTFAEDFKEPSKTVFGVGASWVDKGEIRQEYLAKIKTICTSLSLEPTGFVVLPEAIANFLKAEEGIPPNAAIVGVGKDFLEIAVFKSGDLSGTTTVARSVSVFEDIIEGLCRFPTDESPPSRIIIYNSKEGELEETKQQLIGSEWERVEKLKFLHPPKVEILIPDKKVRAVALAGASEIGAVALVEPESAPSAQELGFVMGEDVAAKPSIEPLEPRPVPVSRFNKVTSKLKNVRLPDLSGMFGPKPAILGGILGLAAVAFFVFWWFYPKAEIKIYVNPKRFEEKAEILITLGTADMDSAKMEITGKETVTEVSGEKTKSTTGTRRIGDKAKGSVRIQNGKDTVLNLAAGTILTVANDLRFLTVSSVSVTPAVGTEISGKQSVDIVAADIGAEYNLAKDEGFKVANYSKADAEAFAVADITGGSSREVTAVSADDTEDLLNGLTDELTGKAKKDLLAKIAQDQIFIDDSLTATVSSKVFSSKVGDEAGSLKLSLGLKTGALVVAKDDLIVLAKRILADSSPSGFGLSEDNLNFSFRRLDGNRFDLKITADFLPDEDLAALAKEISGKAPSSVEEKFASVPGFSRAEINIRPRFPGPLKIIPPVSKNVSVKIVSER